MCNGELGNYKATPEFATAKIQVWWDMTSCPIPEGYDARGVRPKVMIGSDGKREMYAIKAVSLR
ncbi:hypothetical protein Bca52824_019226 [Brassica carinata]|uniref:NYN domain-containing protein n=1 Tax=Brassica carinata TaxID=52824 RepID=A0A8X8AX67_BRACI|nr:hypothetical protein Bca52824_019226 [Brassica carinata]